MPEPAEIPVRDVPKLTDLSQSRFVQRLGDFKPSVETASKAAAELLKTVNASMPLYTLHDERHILNVLAWMEWLAGDVIEQLSPTECALCVLAAFTHDLGMTLTPTEHEDLCGTGDSPERRKFQQFRDGFAEEKHEIERLSKSSDASERYAGRMLEQHLLTEFLRTTHAPTIPVRLKARLDQIMKTAKNESLFTFGGVDFRAWLELIAISHNQQVGWLREQLVRGAEHRSDGFVRTDGNQQSVNAVFVGLLLRLADIMDFDASRTPTILFHHLGLDRELRTRFEEKSQDEWKKHLAITGTPIVPTDTGWEVTYEASACDHPAIHKSILEFVGWIQREVSQCQIELDYSNRQLKGGTERYRMRLPRVQEQVTPKKDRNEVPVYQFQDWQFRLDQQEIIRLLMGESLYGDPSLCIRELLQNSLDALELRDLRLQLPKAERREPVDGVKITGKPGFYWDADGNEQRLDVSLTWGRDGDDGPWWIKVEDNGVGMTPAVIERFFTQLGRSFYRSAEFESEKALLRAHGLLATPISQFGIGVLLCFMIADRIEVRTCPGGANWSDLKDPRRATDLTISGPGSLFWTKPGTRKEQGTEIKLILRRTLKGQPVRLCHDEASALKALRRHFNYEGGTPEYPLESGLFDPAYISAQHVVWPKYPVRAATNAIGLRHWLIDDGFHTQMIAPLDLEKLRAKASEWDIPLDQLGEPTWHHFDWVDSSDQNTSTGTRIRVWFARPDRACVPEQLFDDIAGRLRLSDLAAFVEPQMEHACVSRCRVLVKGMAVTEFDILNGELAGKAGSRTWIDLRGNASPRLTADRRRAVRPENGEEWQSTVADVFQRFQTNVVTRLHGQIGSTRNVQSLIAVKKDARVAFVNGCSRAEIGWHLIQYLNHVNAWPGLSAAQLGIDLDRARARSSGRERPSDADVARASPLARDFELVRPHEIERYLFRSVNTVRALAWSKDMSFNRELTRTFFISLVRSINSNLARGVDRNDQLGTSGSLRAHSLDRDVKFDRKYAGHFAVSDSSWADGWSLGFLQFGFWPNLEESWPTFELFPFSGVIGNALLTAPGGCRFDLESDGRTVAFADRDGTQPSRLTELGYDLCYPLPSIPLGRLRLECANWRTDRGYQALGTMPLLFPSYADVWPKHLKVL